MDLILTDTELIESHRKESGAPEPPPLEEVELPQIGPLRPVGGPRALLGTLKPPAAFGGATKPGGGLQPSSAPSRYSLSTRTPPPPSGSPGGPPRLVQKISPLKAPARLQSPSAPSARSTARPGPARPDEAAEEYDNAEGPRRPPLIRPAVRSATSSGAPAPSSGPASELRQIALFISKWQLEPTKAKLVLARLPASRRRWVMANYDGEGNLASFIQHVSRTNAWANASPGASGAPGTSGTGAIAPKRPLSSSEGSGYEPSKRPRIGAAPTSSTSRPPPPPPRGSVGARQAANASEAPPHRSSGRPPPRAPTGNRIPPRIAPSTPSTTDGARSGTAAGRARPSGPKSAGTYGGGSSNRTSAPSAPPRPPSASPKGSKGSGRSSQPPTKPSPRSAGGGSNAQEEPGSLIRNLLKLA